MHLVTPVPEQDTDDPAVIVGALTEGNTRSVGLARGPVLWERQMLLLRRLARCQLIGQRQIGQPSGSVGVFGYPQEDSRPDTWQERVARIWMNNNQAPAQEKDVKIPAGDKEETTSSSKACSRASPRELTQSSPAASLGAKSRCGIRR